MSLSGLEPIIQTDQPALELIALARMSPEVASQNLRTLLLQNPNYFGRITGSSFQAVLRIQEDTTYECLSRVGYSPGCEQLEARIHLNRSAGYSSATLGKHSSEYVRFYLSYDAGFSWLDQGLRSVGVFDGLSATPFEHVVTAEIGPARAFRFMRNLPLIRGILSWNVPPPRDLPDWTPVWGNVVEAQVRIDEFSAISLEAMAIASSVGQRSDGAAA